MEVLDLALKFLAGKDRSTYEIKKHLLEKGADVDETDQVLEHLTQMQYLDDVEYCLRYVERAKDKGKSIKRIQLELHEKGISSELIWEALEKLGFEDRQAFEKDMAYRQAEKLVRNQRNLRDPQEDHTDLRCLRGKLARKLSARGFDADVVYHVVCQVLGDEQWEQ